MSNKHLSELRNGLFEDGDVWIFGQMDSRGMGADGVERNHQTKVDKEQVKDVAKYINGKHSKGESVVARHIIALLLDMYGRHIHRRTVGRLVVKLGLTWSGIKPVKKTFAAHRKKVIQDF